MAVTTRRSMYERIRQALAVNIESVSQSLVYISSRPVLNGTDDRFIQIVPGSWSAKHARTGTGEVVEEFEVVSWVRLTQDYGGQHTQLITDETLGLLALSSEVQTTMTHRVLSSSVYPIQSLGGSPVVAEAEMNGWGMVSDRFRATYEIFSGVQNDG